MFRRSSIDPLGFRCGLLDQALVNGQGGHLSTFSDAPRLIGMAIRKIVVDVARFFALRVLGTLTLVALAPIVTFSIMVHVNPVEAGAFPMPSVAGMPQEGSAIMHIIRSPAMNRHNLRFKKVSSGK